VTAVASTRPGLIGRALRLEYLTVGWNLIEGVVAIAAAFAAGSVALMNASARCSTDRPPQLPS